MSTGITQRVHEVLSRAGTEAARHGDPEIAPAHLALALLDEGQGVASAILENHRVDVSEVRRGLERSLLVAGDNEERGDGIPFGAGAREVMHRAAVEARALQHPYIGTEHLLLALLHPVAEDVGGVFAGHGLTYAEAVDEVVRLLGIVRGAN